MNYLSNFIIHLTGYWFQEIIDIVEWHITEIWKDRTNDKYKYN